MTIDEIIQIVNSSIDKKLSPLQETILRQTWEGKTYVHIASELHYKQEYIRRIASNLWNCLSDIWQIEISKNNFRYTLEKKQLTEIEIKLLKKLNTETLIKYISYPDHPLPVDSPLYVERQPLEQIASEEITKPGSLIRIKGAEKYGKSSFVLRLLDKVKRYDYNTVIIDFREADQSVFNNIDQLLRWFFINISLKLGITPRVDEYWRANIGSKVSCSLAIEINILQELNSPLVLALNQVNLIFEYPELADDFFSLLRYWYEKGKTADLWQKMRLVLTYSADNYIIFNLNDSPFNTGLFINLHPLNLEQVKELFNVYGFQTISDLQLQKLNSLIGGHPYLIQITLYNLFRRKNKQNPRITLERILNNACRRNSIYYHHLQYLFYVLKKNIETINALNLIVNHQITSNDLEPKILVKLESLGLIGFENDRIILSCELYRNYFTKELVNLTVSNSLINNLTSTLSINNEKLQYLSQIDLLTQLPNRDYFEQCLENYWQSLLIERKPLSVIICDLDFFQAYRETYGSKAGDECLKKVASLVKKSVRRSSDLVARYSGEELAIILPYADVYFAFQVAAKIRDRVRDLKITQVNRIDNLSPILTISSGLACMIPSPNYSWQQLLEATNAALKVAQNNGKNQVSISSVFHYGLIE